MSFSLKILLVDSSRFFRTIEKQFLSKTPATILEAENGEAGIAMCRSENPDLIYMGYDLNDMSGPECCRKIKATATLASIPIVMICDENEPDQVDASRKAGAEGSLTKPIDRHKFMEIGRHYLPTIREPRRTCLFPIVFRDGDKSYNGKCLDISCGGLFVDTIEKFTPGKVLEFELTLPNQNNGALICRGAVAWHNERPNPTKPNYPLGFGVRFVDLPQAVLSSIEAFTRR